MVICEIKHQISTHVPNYPTSNCRLQQLQPVEVHRSMSAETRQALEAEDQVFNVLDLIPFGPFGHKILSVVYCYNIQHVL